MENPQIARITKNMALSVSLSKPRLWSWNSYCQLNGKALQELHLHTKTWWQTLKLLGSPKIWHSLSHCQNHGFDHGIYIVLYFQSNNKALQELQLHTKTRCKILRLRGSPRIWHYLCPCQNQGFDDKICIVLYCQLNNKALQELQFHDQTWWQTLKLQYIFRKYTLRKYFFLES